MESNQVQPFVATEVGLTPTQMKELNISDPQMVVELAKEVRKYVSTQGLTTTIQKQEYVMVEGWQFAGSLLGLIGKVTQFDNKSTYDPITFEWKARKYGGGYEQKTHTAAGTYRYYATAVMENAQGRVVGQGFAMCTNLEVKKHTFDEYAILSMAQTRAIGKAARMALAFLIKAAGYQPTPAEEMVDKDDPSVEGTTVAGLPDEVEKEIGKFTDAKKLADWANSQVDHHQNHTFLKMVRERIRELS